MAKYRGKYQTKSRSRLFFWFGISCSILALVFAGFIVKFVIGAVKASNDRRQTIQSYVSPMPSQISTPAEGSEQVPIEECAVEEMEVRIEVPETTEATTVPTVPPRFPFVDFAGLREENEDVVAWLQIPALEIINYPVVWGEDNAYYVSHSWKGEESENGAIFLDFRNQSDFTQVHNILYGHCMKDGSMFQTLGKWESASFYEENDRSLILHCPGETRVYEIFAVERVNALDHRVYKTDFTSGEVWKEALNETCRKSQKGTDLELNENSEVLTLSTCVGEMNRLVVHAVCIEKVPV